MVTVTDEGLEYEADQRHAELVAREAGINQGSNVVSTPGVHEHRDDGEEVQVDVRAHRGIAARGNDLGQDRVDIQFAAKDVSRFMANPECKD